MRGVDEIRSSIFLSDPASWPGVGQGNPAPSH